jgi:hypothetical protein
MNSASSDVRAGSRLNHGSDQRGELLFIAQDVDAYIGSTEKIRYRAMTEEDTLKAIDEMLQGMESQ